MNFLPEIIGWIGSFLVLLAYFLVSSRKIKANSTTYQLLNIFGAFGVGVNVFFQHAWPALALQTMWGLIAIISLLRIHK